MIVFILVSNFYECLGNSYPEGDINTQRFSLRITDLFDDVSIITNAWIQYKDQPFLYCMTRSRNRLKIELAKIKKISIFFNSNEKPSFMPSTDPAYILANVELKNGDSKTLYLITNTFGLAGVHPDIQGVSEFGQQSFYFSKIKTIEFNGRDSENIANKFPSPFAIVISTGTQIGLDLLVKRIAERGTSELLAKKKP